jgi:hypothetical protein
MAGRGRWIRPCGGAVCLVSRFRYGVSEGAGLTRCLQRADRVTRRRMASITRLLSPGPRFHHQRCGDRYRSVHQRPSVYRGFARDIFCVLAGVLGGWAVGSSAFYFYSSKQISIAYETALGMALVHEEDGGAEPRSRQWNRMPRSGFRLPRGDASDLNGSEHSTRDVARLRSVGHECHCVVSRLCLLRWGARQTHHTATPRERKRIVAPV